jgi:hypothetical protein
MDWSFLDLLLNSIKEQHSSNLSLLAQIKLY